MLGAIWDYSPYIIKYSAFMVGALGFFGLLALWMFQCDLVYPSSFPATSRERVPLPSQYGMPDFDDVHLDTHDNVKIRGYLIKRPTEDETRKAPTILYLQANAGNIGHRLPIAKMLYDSLNCNIFMLSYRGYGLSEGQPREAGIRLDALTALEFIRSHHLTANTKLIAYGQSLGGAVAIDIIANEPNEFAGAILENTFLSIPKLIPSVMPWLKYVSFLSSEKWCSEDQIKKITNVPILFLSGQQDDLVPSEHMKMLYDLSSAYNEKPVSIELFPNGKHNDTCVQPEYFDKVKQWWEINVIPAPKYKPTGRVGGELREISRKSVDGDDDTEKTEESNIQEKPIGANVSEKSKRETMVEDITEVETDLDDSE
ncbi:bem46 protein, variant [Mycoemilia scoparia]|uniref:Bem46 protein, variant n=1 Tax=Mycoemilia scoparia TaxID=417184 RepID=A0A9W8DRY7_9FUNG|nr:bem46 protein, variant [Mycoemilia scoparia]